MLDHPELGDFLCVEVGDEVAGEDGEVGFDPAFFVRDAEDVCGAEVVVEGGGGLDLDVDGGFGEAVGAEVGLDCGVVFGEGEN